MREAIVITHDSSIAADTAGQGDASAEAHAEHACPRCSVDYTAGPEMTIDRYFDFLK